MEDIFDGIPSCNPGWNDCTDVDYSNRRKKSFRVFQKSPNVKILNIFSAGQYYGIEYFHTIFEEMPFKTKKPEGEYKLMTREEIKEKFNIEI